MVGYDRVEQTLTVMSLSARKGIRLLSWNLNSLGDKLKRGIVLQCIKGHSPDVFLLQETHLIWNACRALIRWGYKLVAHSAFTTGSRGRRHNDQEKLPNGNRSHLD